MNKKNDTNQLKRKFWGNMIFAFMAQSISLMVSLLLSFIVPKFLNVEEFAYWQLFIFYTNYVNIAQIGIVDGIYLRFGGRKYEELDYGLIKAEYLIFIGFQFAISFLIMIGALIFAEDNNKILVFLGVAVYLVIYNLSRFLGIIFQAVNNTRWYSIASMIDRMVIFFIGMIVILTKNISWSLLVCIYIFGFAVSLIYTWIKGKKIILTKCRFNIKEIVLELKHNSIIGIKLMISNLAGALILGCGRQSIEWHWGLEIFGEVSFAISMINFFLLFINQISLVLFPVLRQIDKEQAKQIFKKAEFGFSIISPIIYILYIPASVILKNWLPQYKNSLTYLILFLPICVFDGKMQMLYNTYLKVLRKEKMLLNINLISMVLSILFCIASVFIFDSLQIILLGLCTAIIIRSLMADYFLTKLLGCKLSINILYDFCFAALFVLLSFTQKNIIAIIALIVIFISFVAAHKKQIAGLRI